MKNDFTSIIKSEINSKKVKLEGGKNYLPKSTYEKLINKSFNLENEEVKTKTYSINQNLEKDLDLTKNSIEGKLNITRDPENQHKPDLSEQAEKADDLQEIYSQLRARNQPIRLFGETDFDIKLRLEKTLKQDNKNQIESLVNNNVTQQNLISQEQDKQNSTTNNINEILNQDYTRLTPKLLKENRILLYELLAKYLKFILLKWQYKINTENNEKEIKKLNILVNDMKPLFKFLNKRCLNESVLVLLTTICSKMIVRDYRGAGEAYMTLSIGHAPWPTGIKMKPIHERKAREPIVGNQIAYALNNEEKRKWVHGLKRMITFAEIIFPFSQ